MNIVGFALGALIARQNNVPAGQSTTIALASGMIKSPLLGVLIASAVARNLRPPPPPQAAAPAPAAPTARRR